MVVGVANLRRITEAVVRTRVRSTVEINLQKRTDLLIMAPCWALSIEFDRETNEGDDQFDLHVCFFAGGSLQNVHVPVLTMT